MCHSAVSWKMAKGHVAVAGKNIMLVPAMLPPYFVPHRVLQAEPKLKERRKTRLHTASRSHFQSYEPDFLPERPSHLETLNIAT
jgi:hypothetical protein